MFAGSYRRTKRVPTAVAPVLDGRRRTWASFFVLLAAGFIGKWDPMCRRCGRLHLTCGPLIKSRTSRSWEMRRPPRFTRLDCLTGSDGRRRANRKRWSCSFEISMNEGSTPRTEVELDLDLDLESELHLRVFRRNRYEFNRMPRQTLVAVRLDRARASTTCCRERMRRTIRMDRTATRTRTRASSWAVGTPRTWVPSEHPK